MFIRSVLLLIVMYVAVPAAAQTGDAPRPNIILILADDLGYGDLGCYGQEHIRTPHLDALAAGGLRLSQHYAGSTVCAPSRCVLMTGRHTGHATVRGNSGGRDGFNMPLHDHEPTVATVLRDAGYRTAAIGKWALGGPVTPNAAGFDDFFGYLNQSHAHNYYTDHLWRNDDRVELDNVMTPDTTRADVPGCGVAIQRNTYTHDLFMQEALRFIGDGDGPFFLYLALTIPHTNNEAGRFREHIPADHAERLGQEVPDEGDYADEDWPGPQRGTAAMITRMDAGIGELVARLESLGIADNTLILFTSDNGPHREGGNDPAFFRSSGPLRGIKRSLYEGGIRVPMIVYWPAVIQPGRDSHHISAFWDVLPTLAELAGGDAPEGLDGISFVPTLRGIDGQREHDYLYWEFYEQGGRQAVRAGDWKAVRQNVHQDATGPLELYNLADDPGETTNLADDHPAIVAAMEQVMREARTADPNWRFRGE